jgi:hypothetical protein
VTVTVLAVALDPFGAQVLECARGWVAPESEGGPVLVEVAGEGDPVAALERPLFEAIRRRTRAGAITRRGGPGVQIAVFTDVEASGAESVTRLLTTLSAMLTEQFGPMFRAQNSPDQRNAALHVVARVPPMAIAARTVTALKHLAALEGWAPPRDGYPLLARIWPLSTITTAGSVTDGGLVTTGAVWLATLAASEEADALELRFRHPAGSRRVSMFSAATLSTPELTIAEYASLRARYDGLARVAVRVSRPAVASQAESLARRFPLDDLTGAVEASGAAAKIRALAAEASGVGSVEDVPVDVRPFDAASVIRERNAALLAAQGSDAGTRFPADARLSLELDQLTAVESQAIGERVESALDDTFADALAPGDGLVALPDVRDALRWLRSRAEGGVTRGTLGTEETRSKTVDADPHRAAVEDALAALPSPARRVIPGLLAGFAVGLLAACVTAWLLPPVADYGPATLASAVSLVVSAGATPTSPVGDEWNPRMPWITGGLLGAVAAAVYSFFVARAAVRLVREALAVRRGALSDLRRSGGAGEPRRRLDREIAVRAQRLRLGVAYAIDLRLRRIEAIVALVNGARDEASRRLQALGVVLARRSPAAAEDDLGGLFPEDEALHGHLLAPASLARWVAGLRNVADPDIWATRLVAETWDSKGRDGPCLDEALLRRACDEQVEGVRRTSMLAVGTLAGEAAERVAGFAKNVAHSLGPPVAPATPEGDSIGLSGAAQVALVPASEGHRVRDAMKRAAGDYTQQEIPSLRARLALVRFWEDFAVENLARGAGLPSLEPAE